jgi:gliding motility-associated lipoprotein GldH
MHRFLIKILTILFLFGAAGCIGNGNKVYDQFQGVKNTGWHWKEPKRFDFEIQDESMLYNVTAQLRISGNYFYSNIWMKYELSGPAMEKKNEFQIVLADNTGKWLGKGRNNLINYNADILKNVKLKKGKYSILIYQNMRDEELSGVNDIGLRVEKSQKVF